jgi:ketosteroid isomerase-like protein
MRRSGPFRMPVVFAAVGSACAIAGRSVLSRVLLIKFQRDVRALNEGDYRPLLSAYAKNAVLRFNDGDHRWAGDHRGRPEIERFLQNFVAAGLKGELRELFAFGPPWRLTLLVRFDDQAVRENGEELYRNRTVLLIRTRWGRVVEQEDFYEDTERISALEARLRELGVPAAT